MSITPWDEMTRGWAELYDRQAEMTKPGWTVKPNWRTCWAASPTMVPTRWRCRSHVRVMAVVDCSRRFPGLHPSGCKRRRGHRRGNARQNDRSARDVARRRR